MVLEIRHLRLLDAIRREGNVTRAAAALHLTQPAVSHALRDLEDRLGANLFRREDRRMVPTAEGDRVLRTAAVVLDEVQRAEFDVEQIRQGQQGVVRIATGCYTCYSWLPSILQRFNERFPDVSLTIAPDEKMRPIQALLGDRLDLAIVSSKPETAGIVAKKLFEDEMIAIVPPGHPWAVRDVVEAEDFENEHLINHGEIETTTIHQEVLLPAGVVPARCTSLPLTEAIIQAVRSGIGVSVLAGWLVASDVEAGTVSGVRIGKEGLNRTWYAAVRDFKAETPVMKRLIAELGEHGHSAAFECCSRHPFRS